MNKHPMVHQVVELLFADQGLSAPKNYKLPEWFDDVAGGEKINWERAERALARMTSDELETFAIGDEDDQKEIRDRIEDGHYAHHVLDTMFLVMMV
jgi:hypothetical protein